VIRLAQALGRPLLAVPGSVTSSESGFAHQLLRDGTARLARDARDVLADLAATAGGRR
jgi:DNA processing protein